MSYKNLINPATVTMLVSLGSAILLIQFLGSQWNDLAQKVFVLTLYALFIGSYILRIILVFIGVFAVYRILRERVHDQRREANAGLPVLSQDNLPTF